MQMYRRFFFLCVFLLCIHEEDEEREKTKVNLERYKEKSYITHLLFLLQAMSESAQYHLYPFK